MKIHGSMVALILGLAVGVSACGDDGETPGAGGQGLAPTGTGGAGGADGGSTAAGGTGAGATGGFAGAPPGCGDGTKTDDEPCDDGNRRSHDGCSSGCTVEEPTWAELSPVASPVLRVDHALAYDPERDHFVSFGGYRSGALVETWEFDAFAWWQRSPGAEPSARYDHAMVYDSVAQAVLLYGGSSGGIDGLDDTWSFDGTTWTPLGTGTPPGSRYQHAMAFDSVRGCAVVFGGTHAGATLGDTLELCSGVWTAVTPTVSPPARFGHAMAYDPNIARVVLFGGYDDTGDVEYADTWEYDGSTWSPISTATVVPHRRFHHLAFDGERQRIVMAGGYDGTSEVGETWEYVAGNWVETTPPVSPRGGPMAYDARRHRLLMSDVPGGGAVNRTWVYWLASDWPDEICDNAGDDDGDDLVDCADEDCDGLPCDGGRCSSGTCQ